MKKLHLLLLTLSSITAFGQSYFQQNEARLPIANRAAPESIVASTSYQGYEEDQAYFGEGIYEIFIDNVDGILNKPIIVLDGFDPGDSRDITGLYNNLNFGGSNLADVLRDDGFDIVILNAPQYTTDGKDIDGGSDYIQRNALVLIELINLLNEQKVGEEELVVLGPSMGGLIARYALATMEAENMDHETRLYISFDSPHRGANIPISLQYLINYLAESLGDADALAIVDQVLNSPAAKEMLIDHLSAHLVDGSFEQDPTKLLPEGAPNFRDAFQAELDALGFPTEVRNVAMINGSGNGTTSGTPGMLVVDTSLDIATATVADITIRFTPEASQTNTVTNSEVSIAGIPVSTFSADAESFGFTDGVDAAPGGTSNISNALGDGSGNPLIMEFIDALQQDAFCFIPTISALAIENEDDWYAIPDIGGTHSSAFVNTFIPSENEDHVDVTAASAQFAIDEIVNGSLGIEDIATPLRYKLAQNPINENLQIILDKGFNYGKVTLTIYAATGQLVFNTSMESPQNMISIQPELSSGLYILQLEDTQGMHRMKVLKN